MKPAVTEGSRSLREACRTLLRSEVVVAGVVAVLHEFLLELAMEVGETCCMMLKSEAVVAGVLNDVLLELGIEVEAAAVQFLIDFVDEVVTVDEF